MKPWEGTAWDVGFVFVEEGRCRRWQDRMMISNYIIDQLKKSQISPFTWPIFLLLFLIVRLNLWEECGMERGAWGFESHGGGVAEDGRTRT